MKIATKKYIKQITEQFRNEPSTGMVGAKEFLRNEWNLKQLAFESENNTMLTGLIKKYQLQMRGFDFIGGTMFWVRSSILEHFFGLHSALEARAQLEKGNVMDNLQGTFTHSWERLFGLIVSEKYKVKGV